MESLTLTDGSMKMLEQSFPKLEKLKSSWKYWLNSVPISTLKADSEDLPFENDSFDTVVSTLTLCSFDNPEKALLEMSRVVKKNGKILFLEHGKSCKDKPDFNASNWEFINNHLDRNADNQNWGCRFNRNVGEMIQSIFNNTSFKRFHFGTTLYATAYPSISNQQPKEIN
eukprot:NODE_55_length_29507_cov_0.809712.p20 type:complete len:170 gc:universal NODE_55_length_29507_cov_0.809712:22291-21782(-)